MPPIEIASAGSVVLPLVVGCSSYRQLPREMKALMLLLMLSLLIEIGLLVLRWRNLNSVWLFHIFTPIQYTLLAWIFAAWHHRAGVKRWIYASIVFILLTSLLMSTLVVPITQFNSFTRSLASILLIMISALTLYELNRITVGVILRVPIFWVASAVLLYFTGNLFTFSLNNLFLVYSMDVLGLLWTIHAAFTILTNFLFASGFLCLR